MGVRITQLSSKRRGQTYMVMIWDEKKRKKKTCLEDFETNEIPKIFFCLSLPTKPLFSRLSEFKIQQDRYDTSV